MEGIVGILEGGCWGVVLEGSHLFSGEWGGVEDLISFLEGFGVCEGSDTKKTKEKFLNTNSKKFISIIKSSQKCP